MRLAPWHERERKQQQIAAEMMPQLLAIPGVRAFALNPPSLGPAEASSRRCSS